MKEYKITIKVGKGTHLDLGSKHASASLGSALFAVCSEDDCLTCQVVDDTEIPGVGAQYLSLHIFVDDLLADVEVDVEAQGACEFCVSRSPRTTITRQGYNATRVSMLAGDRLHFSI